MGRGGKERRDQNLSWLIEAVRKKGVRDCLIEGGYLDNTK